MLHGAVAAWRHPRRGAVNQGAPLRQEVVRRSEISAFHPDEKAINPKSKVKSGGTEGFRHPDANNPFYELRAPLALSGVLALQGRN